MSYTITGFTTFVANTLIKSSEVNENFSNFRAGMIPIRDDTAAAIDDTYDLGSGEYFWRYTYNQQVRFRDGIYLRGNLTASSLQYSTDSGTTWLNLGQVNGDFLPRDSTGSLNDSVNDIGQASVGGSNYWNTLFINEINFKNGGHFYFTTSTNVGGGLTPWILFSYNSGTTKLPLAQAAGNLLPINISTGVASNNLLNLGGTSNYWRTLYVNDVDLAGGGLLTYTAGSTYITNNSGTSYAKVGHLTRLIATDASGQVLSAGVRVIKTWDNVILDDDGMYSAGTFYVKRNGIATIWSKLHTTVTAFATNEAFSAEVYLFSTRVDGNSEYGNGASIILRNTIMYAFSVSSGDQFSVRVISDINSGTITDASYNKLYIEIKNP